jgi:DNA topoisomerase-1
MRLWCWPAPLLHIGRSALGPSLRPGRCALATRAAAAGTGGKTLVVVESPSKAATISKYLGKDYTVLASYGHVRDLQAKAGAVQPDKDWALAWDVLPRAQPRVAAIQEALLPAGGVSRLLLATDPDREGEAIAWHLLEVLRQTGALRRLSAVGRASFTEVTKGAVEAALAAPRELSTDLVDAYKARRALDFVVGYTLSPVLWRKLPGAKSAGRVQSVALRLIVERAQAISCFVPEHFWVVAAQLRTQGGVTVPASVLTLGGEPAAKLLDVESAQAAVELLMSRGQGEVAAVKTSTHARAPQAPFTTSTLQQAASSLLGMGASATMSVAQRLFETGSITYHRSDSPALAPDAAAALRDVARACYGPAAVPAAPRAYAAKAKNAQEAHEAIRPTDPSATPAKLQGTMASQELAVYSLIWRRSVASQMKDCLRERTHVEVHVRGPQGKEKGKKPAATLRVKGSRVVDPGWLAVTRDASAWPARAAQAEAEDAPPPQPGDDAADSGDGDISGDTLLPPFAVGDVVTIISAATTALSTSPPPRHSEGALVKDMEALGVGRPSTYAPTIQVLLARKYAVKDGSRLVPTSLGWVVALYLQSYFPTYVDAAFTARMEAALDDVASGQLMWQLPLTEFHRPFSDAVSQALGVTQRAVIDVLDEQLAPSVFPTANSRACPACGTGRLGVKLSRHEGAFVGCSNFDAADKCTYASPLFGEQQADGAAPGSAPAVLFPRELGLDGATGGLVTLHQGPYGLYVQMDNTPATKKAPRRASVPKTLAAGAVTLEHALDLLSLPRTLGAHPSDGIEVLLRNGPFGLFVQHGDLMASLSRADLALLDGSTSAMTLDMALARLEEKKTRLAKRGLRAKPAPAAKVKGSKPKPKAAARPAAKAPAKEDGAAQPAKKRANAFIVFCVEQRKQGKATAAELGARWRALPDAEKADYAAPAL